MNKNQFLKNIPEENRAFYSKQIKASNIETNKIILPYVIWLPLWNFVSYNTYRGSKKVREIEMGMKKKAMKWLTVFGVRPVMRVKEKREIIFERIWPKNGQEMDEDNYIIPLKMMKDVIVMLGLLYDDAPKYCKASYQQRKFIEGEEFGLKITIKEKND